MKKCIRKSDGKELRYMVEQDGRHTVFLSQKRGRQMDESEFLDKYVPINSVQTEYERWQTMIKKIKYRLERSGLYPKYREVCDVLLRIPEQELRDIRLRLKYQHYWEYSTEYKKFSYVGKVEFIMGMYIEKYPTLFCRPGKTMVPEAALTILLTKGRLGKMYFGPLNAIYKKEIRKALKEKKPYDTHEVRIAEYKVSFAYEPESITYGSFTGRRTKREARAHYEKSPVKYTKKRTNYLVLDESTVFEFEREY